MRRGARAARQRVFKRTIPQQLQYAPVDPASLGLEDALRECLRREETRRPGYRLWERDGVWPPRFNAAFLGRALAASMPPSHKWELTARALDELPVDVRLMVEALFDADGRCVAAAISPSGEHLAEVTLNHLNGVPRSHTNSGAPRSRGNSAEQRPGSSRDHARMPPVAAPAPAPAPAAAGLTHLPRVSLFAARCGGGGGLTLRLELFGVDPQLAGRPEATRTVPRAAADGAAAVAAHGDGASEAAPLPDHPSELRRVLGAVEADALNLTVGSRPHAAHGGDDRPGRDAPHRDQV